jgi:putative ABC transport system permease protein
MAARAAAVYRALEGRAALGPPIRRKAELTYQLSRSWPRIRHFVIPLGVYVSEVAQLLDALRYTAYGLYGLIIIIVLAGISSTYRTILRDRLREIGTMRVLGLRSGHAHAVLLWESGLVFLTGFAVGTVFSFVLTGLFSLIPFGGIPGFEIFMQNGRLTASHSLGLLLTNAAFFAVTSLPAVWLPSLRACRVGPAHAISGGAS